MKDPYSANLQKVQIVKAGPRLTARPPSRSTTWPAPTGWNPTRRRTAARTTAPRWTCPDCSYPTDLGAAELSTTWTDPDFDPALRAFYYVRVLENPTCRWTTHRALARGVAPPSSEVPMVKERAWSSPIWYTPAAP